MTTARRISSVAVRRQTLFCLPGTLWRIGFASVSIQRVQENATRRFEALRRTLHDLRPSILDQLGIVPALRWFIRQSEISGSDVRIECRLPLDDSAIPAPPDRLC
jgi:signal transduction histidine kinase